MSLSICNTCKNINHLAMDCKVANCGCQHRTPNQQFYDQIKADGGTPLIVRDEKGVTSEVYVGPDPEPPTQVRNGTDGPVLEDSSGDSPRELNWDNPEDRPVIRKLAFGDEQPQKRRRWPRGSR